MKRIIDITASAAGLLLLALVLPALVPAWLAAMQEALPHPAGAR